ARGLSAAPQAAGAGKAQGEAEGFEGKEEKEVDAALQLADERARHRVPRPGMGRPGARRPAALRVPDPRGRAGGPELVDDLEEARELPPGLCGFRADEGRTLHGFPGC